MSSTVGSGTKWMRKGTTSCQECRRRKIKCTSTMHKPMICDQCSENGRLCKSQGITSGSRMTTGTDKWTGLKIRLSRLESRVERLSKVVTPEVTNLMMKSCSQALPQSSPTPDTKMMLESLAHQVITKPPILELFDNELILTKDEFVKPPNLHCMTDFGLDKLSDTEKLMSVISKETDIMCVLYIASSWWIPWQNFYPGLKELGVAISLRSFVRFNLVQRKPVLVATALLCIATSLQRIRPGIDDQNLSLSEPASELMNRITAAVDQIVLDNDDYISCFEGVLILLLRGKHHAESNQLRRAWLGIRRSILLAQKIGLASTEPQSTTIGIQCKQFVDGMFETDRFFSLFLGMPYALDLRLGDPRSDQNSLQHPSIDQRMRTLRRMTAVAAGDITDRESGPEEFGVNLTTKIQNFMESARKSMPLDWWTVDTHSANISNASLAYEHLHTQLWFYQTQCLLHLRYMLKAVSDPAYDSNRKSCLEASRGLVKVWATLRQSAVLSQYTCRLDDFQGLTSVLIILIGLLQYYSQGLEPEYSCVKSDMDLVAAAREVFHQVAQEQCGSIAKQSLRVIQILSNFIQFEEGSNPFSGDLTLMHRSARLFVPYFGAISIESRPFAVSKQIPPVPQNHLRYPGLSPNVTSCDPTADLETERFIDSFLSESSFDYQESLWASSSQSSGSTPIKPIEVRDVSSEIRLASEAGGLPTEVVSGLDKITMEIDPDQEWSMAFTQYVDL